MIVSINVSVHCCVIVRSFHLILIGRGKRGDGVGGGGG